MERIHEMKSPVSIVNQQKIPVKKYRSKFLVKKILIQQIQLWSTKIKAVDLNFDP